MGMKNKMLLGALLLASSVVWAAPAATAAPTGIDKYELSSFIADFTHFKLGDKVPPLYLTEEYTIKQWNLRNLARTDSRHPLDLHGRRICAGQRCRC